MNFASRTRPDVKNCLGKFKTRGHLMLMSENNICNGLVSGDKCWHLVYECKVELSSPMRCSHWPKCRSTNRPDKKFVLRHRTTSAGTIRLIEQAATVNVDLSATWRPKSRTIKFSPGRLVGSIRRPTNRSVWTAHNSFARLVLITVYAANHNATALPDAQLQEQALFGFLTADFILFFNISVTEVSSKCWCPPIGLV